MRGRGSRRFYLLNLGCAKNLVEGEHLAGALLSAGWEAVSRPERAGLLLVNTCGFIQSAVEESLEAALELAQAKREDQRLVVVGCLVGRYGKKLARSLPEAELLVSPGELGRLLEHLERPPAGRLAISPARGIFGAGDPRALSTGPGWAYLRLADGCDHACAFCTIPRIRGRLRSRPVEDVLSEAQGLVASGVRELNLVAQDTTAYGRDLGQRGALVELLERLDAIEALSWIRLLYLHPDTLEKSVIQAVARLPKVVPYFDLPVQHVADGVLAAMGRRRRGAEIRKLLSYIRETVAGATLRATLMVGHPGEGEAEFRELLAFMEEVRFDHLGCFAYQPEAGTRSARRARVSEDEARRRVEEVMVLQRGISRQRLAALVGCRQEVLVLGPHPDSDLVWHGRLASQAPEVDGVVIITEGWAPPGRLALCEITRSHDYDLEGRLGPKTISPHRQ